MSPMMFAIPWNVDPEIISITETYGPRWYGLCFALGIWLGYLIMLRYKDKGYFSEDSFNSLFIYFIVGTIAGARLGHCLFYEPEFYLRNPLQILMVWKGGLASHGGVIGIVGSVMIYCYNWKINFVRLADLFALPIAVGVPFIRIGNFFNSEMIGKPADVPWAVVFERIDQVPRHPGQLYEATWYFGSALLLYGVLKLSGKALAPPSEARPKSKKQPTPASGNYLSTGIMIGLMFVLIFSGRMFVEQFKLNQVDFEEGMLLNMGQILSIPMIIIGVVLIFFGSKLSQIWAKKFG